MNKTSIEWVRNPDGSQGYTWNPITGCLNHTDGLCKGGEFPCYACKLARGRLKAHYLSNKTIAPAMAATNLTQAIYSDVALLDPFYPRFWEEKVEALIKRNEYLDGDLPVPTKRKGIFVCDMGDLFGPGIPEDWTRRILDTINWNKGYDRFYLLTKQPQNLVKFSPFPENCWVGVTCTNQTMVLGATNHLYNHRLAKTQFLSIEPLLSWDTSHFSHPLTDSISKLDLDWLIIGACTGTYAEMLDLHHRLHGHTPAIQVMEYGKRFTLQPRVEWVREIVQAADKAGIPVFLKDNLRPLLDNEPTNPLYWSSICDDERGKERVDDNLRQEMPKR